MTFPVEPCRIVDTRVALGPLASGSGMSVFVRGSLLDPLNGAAQTNCGVPAEAEAVIVNVVAVGPTSNGVLKVNGSGFVYGPTGQYSRLNYQIGQNTANEMVVSLCNVYLYPHAHAPCAFDGAGRYSDFQIVNAGSVGSSVHIVADVVGYLAQP